MVRQAYPAGRGIPTWHPGASREAQHLKHIHETLGSVSVYMSAGVGITQEVYTWRFFKSLI